MTTVITLALILIARTILEACRGKPRADGHDFLALMNAGVLPVSKKASGRQQQVRRRR